TRLHHMDHIVSFCLTCAGQASPHLPPISSNITMPLLRANSMLSSCHRPLHPECVFSGHLRQTSVLSAGRRDTTASSASSSSPLCCRHGMQSAACDGVTGVVPPPLTCGPGS